MQGIHHRGFVAFAERDLRIMIEVQVILRVRGIQHKPSCRDYECVGDNARQFRNLSVVLGASAGWRKLTGKEGHVSKVEVLSEISNQRVHLSGPSSVAAVRFPLMKEHPFDHRASLARAMIQLYLLPPDFRNVSIFSPLTAQGTSPMLSPAGTTSIRVFAK